MKPKSILMNLIMNPLIHIFSRHCPSTAYFALATEAKKEEKIGT